MDISSKNAWPSNALSNFAAHEFTFRGIKCASMEGLLQSLKFDDPLEQVKICSLVGKEAKAAGKKRTKAWQAAQTLWWMSSPIKRDSKEYQLLLDEAFAMLSFNKEFQEALMATDGKVLTHKMGRDRIEETILTEKEFCKQLMRLRETILEEQDEYDEEDELNVLVELEDENQSQ